MSLQLQGIVQFSVNTSYSDYIARDIERALYLSFKEVWVEEMNLPWPSSWTKDNLFVPVGSIDVWGKPKGIKDFSFRISYDLSPPEVDIDIDKEIYDDTIESLFRKKVDKYFTLYDIGYYDFRVSIYITEGDMYYV